MEYLRQRLDVLLDAQPDLNVPPANLYPRKARYPTTCHSLLTLPRVLSAGRLATSRSCTRSTAAPTFSTKINSIYFCFCNLCVVVHNKAVSMMTFKCSSTTAYSTDSFMSARIDPPNAHTDSKWCPFCWEAIAMVLGAGCRLGVLARSVRHKSDKKSLIARLLTGSSTLLLPLGAVSGVGLKGTGLTGRRRTPPSSPTASTCTSSRRTPSTRATWTTTSE